jgi:Uma2 family endonuclease
VDAVYLGPPLAAQTPAGTTIVEGIPDLAVEILSPSDTQDDIQEKIDSYLGAGVPLVWTLNPRRRTVTVYRPGRGPELFNSTQVLTADPELPGFRAPVLSFFEDTSP